MMTRIEWTTDVGYRYVAWCNLDSVQRLTLNPVAQINGETLPQGYVIQVARALGIRVSEGGWELGEDEPL